MGREVGDYVDDIIEAMASAISFTEEMPHEEFATDTKTVYAVIWTTEIMGEAAKNIPEEMRREQ